MMLPNLGESTTSHLELERTASADMTDDNYLIDDEKLKLIRKVVQEYELDRISVHSSRRYDELLNFLRNREVVQSINLLSINKLNALFSVKSFPNFLSNRLLVNTLNSLTDEKFKLFCTMFDYRLLEFFVNQDLIKVLHNIENRKLAILVVCLEITELSDLLKNHCYVEAINSIDFEKIDLFNINQLQVIFRNVEVLDGIRFVQFEWLKVFLVLDLSIFELCEVLVNKAYLQVMNSIDIKIITYLQCVRDGLKLFRYPEIVGGIVFIDVKKFKILVNYLKFSDLYELLINQSLVHLINLTKIENILLLCAEWDTVSGSLIDMEIQHNKYFSKTLKFYILLQIFNTAEITHILSNCSFVANAILNKVKIKKLIFLCKKYIGKPLLSLNDQIVIDAMNCLNKNKWKVLISYFSPVDLSEILRSQSFVHAINYLSDFDKFLLIFRKEKELFKNQDFVAKIQSIDIEKLRVLISTFEILNVLGDLLKNQTFVDAINSMDVAKIKCFSADEMRQLFIDQEVINGICCVNTEKLAVFKIKINYSDFVFTELLRNPSNVRSINSLEIIEMSWLLNTLENIKLNFEDEDIINMFRYINLKRLKVLSRYDCKNLRDIARNQDTLQFVGTVDVDTLEIIEISDIVKIVTECDKVRLRWNLCIALALCKAGDIRRVNYDFIKNNETVSDTVRKVFSKNNVNNQSLILSETNLQPGHVSNLKDFNSDKTVVSL